MTAPVCCREKFDCSVPDMFADVRDFHEAMCPDQMAPVPTPLTPELAELRKKLIEEEIEETLKALRENNLEGLADGVVDSIYVLLGTLIAAGIYVNPVWHAVHAANMAKRHGPVREDGKRLKPEGWTPPDVAGILRAQSTGACEGSCRDCPDA